MVNVTHVYSLPELARSFAHGDDPRHLLAGWSTWLVFAYTVAWLLKHSGVVHLVTCTRVYRKKTDRKTVEKVLKVVGECTRPRSGAWALTFGVQVVEGASVPVCVVSARPRAFVLWTRSSYVGPFDPALDTELTVMTLAGTRPLVADPSEHSCNDERDTISVLEPSSNDVRESYVEPSEEIAVPVGMAAGARARVERAARRMADEFLDANRASRVFVLLGSPGTGKSTAARCLALQFKGVLYGLYNPTRAGQCITNVISSWATEKAPLVVVMEEFDVALSGIVRGDARDSDTMVLDARDKSSWNGLLDLVKRKMNVVLVMTTNRTREELLHICDGDASLLRADRVDQFIDFDRDFMDMAATVDAPSPRVCPPTPRSCGGSMDEDDSAMALSATSGTRCKPAAAAGAATRPRGRRSGSGSGGRPPFR